MGGGGVGGGSSTQASREKVIFSPKRGDPPTPLLSTALIGNIIIVGQILNLGQFKVTVQGHFRVIPCQEHFLNFSDTSIISNYILISLSDRSQENSKFNRRKKH